jgi:phage protein U
MSSLNFINRATSELARAEERARKLGVKVQAKVDHAVQRVDKATANVVSHIDEATKLVEGAAKTVDRVLPWVDGSAIQRGLNTLNAGAAKLATSRFAEVKAAAHKLQGAVGVLGKSFTALTGIGGAPGGKAADAVKAISSLSNAAKLPAAADTAVASGNPNLLLLSTAEGTSFRFNLGSLAFDQLRRQSTFHIAAQERLLRPEALQVVSQGGETLTLSGAVYAGGQVVKGSNPIGQLRAIGVKGQPLQLTTGYGKPLGDWLMVSITEEQSAHFVNGEPRKQTFTLEFKRYGNDLKNL